MASQRKLAYLGASGPFGTEIVNALLAAGVALTVLARDPATFSARPGVSVVRYSMDDKTALVEALRGHDAVLCTVNAGAPRFREMQLGLIDAAIAAGVPRFIPSEYAADIYHPLSARVPIYVDRVAVTDYLKEKAAAGEISYTVIHNGPFLEWGLDTGFLDVDLKKRTMRIHDGGEYPFALTSWPTCAAATVAVLTHFAETKNQFVRVQDEAMTQNRLRAILEEAVGAPFAVEQVNSAAVWDSGHERLGKGDFGLDVIRDVLMPTVLMKDGAADWRDGGDNERLGIKPIPVSETVRKYVAEKGLK